MASLPEYNSSIPNGGDSQVINVNAPYIGLEFHYVYQYFTGVLVFLIIPGIGLLYGGMCRRKSALAMVFQSLSVMSVVTFQWAFWGYSLAFSRTGGKFIGDLRYFGLRDVMAAPSYASPYLPELVFCFYELMFAACATMIVVGGSFERGRVVPSIVFGFWWCTLVYCPIANWTWNPNGWLFNLPGLDFAGGGPVHISSGLGALAYALVLGKRRPHDSPKDDSESSSTSSKSPDKQSLHFHKPHNVSIVFLGTVLIWFGWFGFNGGSALNASMRSMLAAYNTNFAASTGVIGWVLVDYIKHNRKFSVIGACEGAIAGLVGITPAAGYVSIWCAALIGFLTAVFVNLCEDVNKLLRVDDGLEVFKLHGIGGMCGAFLTGIFASSSVSSLDGLGTQAPGAIDGNGIQVAKQLAEICAIAGYSFTVSLALLLVLKYIPGMRLRVEDEQEMLGLDLDQFFDETIGEWSLWEVDEMREKKGEELRKGSVIKGMAVEHGVEVDGSESGNGHGHGREMKGGEQDGIKMA